MQQKKRREERTPSKGGSSSEDAKMPGKDGQDSHEQRVWSQLESMKKEVVQLAQAIEAVRVSLLTFKEDTVQSIVSAMMKQYKPIANEPRGKTSPKSNNGVRTAQPSKIQKSEAKKAEKQPKCGQPCIALSSDCSVSPSSPTKGKRNNVKEKRKRSSVSAPKKLHRALQFQDRTNEALTIQAGPFLVDATSSIEDINLLNFIFMDRPAKYMDSCMTVAVVNDVHVTRTDLQCLGPRELVCSWVINLFVSYMNELGNVNWYMNTFLGVLSSGKKHPKKTTDEWVDYTKKVASLEQFEDRVGECERIFIPMLEKLGNDDVGHWFLVVVHPKKRYAKLLDSAPSNSEARQQAARAAMRMLDDIFFKYLDTPPMLGSLPFKDHEDTGPVQPCFSNDCGVFVIRHMQRYGSDWAANYDSHAERACLVIDCVRHEKNEVRGLQALVDRTLLQWKKNEGVIEISDDSRVC